MISFTVTMDKVALQRQAQALIEEMDTEPNIKVSREVMARLKREYQASANLAIHVFNILQKRKDLTAKLLGVESQTGETLTNQYI